MSNGDDADGLLYVDVMRNTGTGFEHAARISTSLPKETVIFDWDGGGADIAGVASDGMGALPNFFLHNDGNFSFTKTTNIPTLQYEGSLTGGDFNEDGVLDLVAPFIPGPDSNRSGFVIHTMPGWGVLQTEDVFGTSAWDAIAGDFNGDGHQDVLVSNIDQPQAALYVGDGSGTVTFDRVIDLPLGGGIARLKALDLDGDGYTDFIAVNGIYERMTVTLSSASGFSSQLLPDSASSAVAGDFDRDGRIDLVVASPETSADHPHGQLLFYRGTADGFVNSGGIAGSFAACCMATVDVNGDGLVDVVSNALDVNASDWHTAGAIAVYYGTP